MSITSSQRPVSAMAFRGAAPPVPSPIIQRFMRFGSHHRDAERDAGYITPISLSSHFRMLFQRQSKSDHLVMDFGSASLIVVLEPEAMSCVTPPN